MSMDEKEGHPEGAGEEAGAAETSAERRLWRETVSVEEFRRRRAEKKAKFDKIVSGLARCPVCGAAAEAGEFGARNYGVWVGCHRSWRCSRNLVWHSEGWSLEEAARVWNFYNGKPIVWLRKAKMWLEGMIWRYGREGREVRKRTKAEEKAREAEMRRIFGLDDEKKNGIWKKMRKYWRKSEKKETK